jgi:hypothetical protein
VKLLVQLTVTAIAMTIIGYAAALLTSAAIGAMVTHGLIPAILTLLGLAGFYVGAIYVAVRVVDYSVHTMFAERLKPATQTDVDDDLAVFDGAGDWPAFDEHDGFAAAVEPVALKRKVPLKRIVKKKPVAKKKRIVKRAKESKYTPKVGW